jgi:hypothetical protein
MRPHDAPGFSVFRADADPSRPQPQGLEPHAHTPKPRRPKAKQAKSLKLQHTMPMPIPHTPFGIIHFGPCVMYVRILALSTYPHPCPCQY